MRKQKIAICFEPPAAGSSADLQDILIQADFLEKYLNIAGYEAVKTPYNDTQSFLNSLNGIDAAWNLFETFHGGESRQHLGAALLEIAGIKYTGTKLESLIFASDKRIIKSILGGAVPTPESYEAGKFCPGTWIIKPVALHGSVGITDASVIEVSTEAELQKALNTSNIKKIAESYIEGKEFSATMLDMGKGLETIAVAEMKFIDYPEGKPKILGFEAKWKEESENYRKTQRSFDVSPATAAALKELANKAAALTGLEGFARLDFRMDKGDGLWLIDVNPNPGLGEDSGFIAACHHAGFSTEHALKYIINAALRG